MTQTAKECCLVASILDNPTAKLGPNTCTAIASWGYWSSPEASKLVEAIGKVIGRGKVPSRAMVSANLDKEYRQWIYHPTFRDSLPESCLESLASELLPRYQSQRLEWLISEACEGIRQKPHKATDIARQLHKELEGVLL